MNGSGSDVGVGIAGMRERLKELEGKLEIESDSSGTLLKASIPAIPTPTSDPLPFILASLSAEIPLP
jgi:signal transduction histidine kinase